MALTTGPFSPKKMAPLNFSWIKFFFKSFKLKYENNNDIFEYKFCVRDFF